MNNNNAPLLPPPLQLKTVPFPVKIAGGLFLFGASSVQNSEEKAFREELLRKAEYVLRKDPLISMELGPGIEAGGVFSSASSTHRGVLVAETDTGMGKERDNGNAEILPVKQMVVEFQLNGGNAWAQARVVGIRYGTDDSSPIQLIYLGVANMEGSMTGGWADVTVPPFWAPPITEYL